MENQKVFIITDDNGLYKDVIISGDKGKQIALTTLDYIEKRNDSEWTKYRIIELPLEGQVHNGHINIITTIKLNNIPVRAMVNNFYNLVEIVESYMNLEDDYRKYSYYTEFIKIN